MLALSGPVAGVYAQLDQLRPVNVPWSPGVEEKFLRGIFELPVVGLELPLLENGEVHGHDPRWLMQQIFQNRPDMKFVLTGIPHTMAQLTAYGPEYGLASADQNGRRAALLDGCQRGLYEQTVRLKQVFGPDAVVAVELHSAPTAAPGRSSADKLYQSLTELLRLDWGKTVIILEHCDALVPGNDPHRKGFLRLQDELAVIVALRDEAERKGRPAPKLGINWARSAIEGRNAETAETHIRELVASDALGTLFFSGCSDQAVKGQSEWADCHLPPASDENVTQLGLSHLESASLLTPVHMRRCFAAAKSVADLLVGVKILQMRDASGGAVSPESAVGAVKDALRLISDSRMWSLG